MCCAAALAREQLSETAQATRLAGSLWTKAHMSLILLHVHIILGLAACMQGPACLTDAPLRACGLQFLAKY